MLRGDWGREARKVNDPTRAIVEPGPESASMAVICTERGPRITPLRCLSANSCGPLGAGRS